MANEINQNELNLENQPQEPKKNKKSADQQNPDVLATVKMKRDPEIYDEPHFADVHPDNVSNYALDGWVIAE